MTCFKCGAKLKKDSVYCHKCGIKQPASSDVTRPVVTAVATPKKNKSSKLTFSIIVAVIVILLVLSITIATLVATNSAMDVGRALSENDFTAAAEIFGTKIKSGTVTQRAAQAAVETYVQSQCSQYADGAADAETVKSNLQAIADMNVINAELTTAALSYVQRIEISRTAWNDAKAAFDAGDYKTAIEQYQLVTDANYANAQQKLEESKNAYREQIIAQADALVQQQNYEGAAFLVQDALTVLPDDARLSQKLSLITEDASSEALEAILSAAETQAAAGDYKGALTTISDAQSVYGADVSFQEKLAEIQNTCRVEMLSQAEAVNVAQGPAAALEIIDDALALLPGDPELLKALETYKAAATTAPSSSSAASNS